MPDSSPSFTSIHPFRIQVGNPRFLIPETQEFEYLFEAMRALFQEETETAFIIWNDIPVRIAYHADAEVILTELCDLLTDICTGALRDFYRLEFTTDLLSARVICLPSQDGKLSCTGTWSPLVFETIHPALNLRQTILVTPADFVAEWRTLIRQILRLLDERGMTFTDPDTQELIRKLRIVSEHENRLGAFYS